MRHAEYPAPAEWAHLVRCVWVFEGQFDEPHDERIVADGCPELILHFGAPYSEPDAAGRWQPQAPLLLAGNLTHALRLRAQGAVGVLGIRLWPQAVTRFIEQPAPATIDRRWPLRHPQLPAWRRALAAASDPARCALVPTLLTALAWPCNEPPDAAVNLAVATLFNSRGQVSPEALARDAGLSLRQLERRLRSATGLSPKRLASLVRFRAVFDELEADTPSPWLHAALAAGYFDQAHMIREFRRYAGQPPRAYLASAGRLSAALVSSKPE
ncbi:MAG: AraC family transcriptional regulator [Burkholderiales bacterium]|uniref:DUF6597 domain-containing transcriptional factor n=1 Tax=Inhella sp. TaxID=1921806 RepID=UPI001AC4054B|nr:AraC family transcriptional regulator [Burkholderiales bacterium]